MTSRSYIAPEGTTSQRRRTCPQVETALRILTARGSKLPGEDHRLVGKCLQLQRVARGVQKEARGLLARLAHETHLRLDDESGTRRLELGGHLLPLRNAQDEPEVSDGHVLTIHFAGTDLVLLRGEVRDDLVTVEV